MKKNVSLWICMCWIDEIIKGLFTKVANHVPKAVLDCDSDPFPIWKPDFTLCKHKALSNQDTKKGVLDRDPPRKPDSGDLWTQSFFRTWFVHAHFGNAYWSHAWVNHRRRTKYYPRLAVRRSCSWLGRLLQCLWAYILQITNPSGSGSKTTFGTWFNHSFVNRPFISRVLINFHVCFHDRLKQKSSIFRYIPRMNGHFSKKVCICEFVLCRVGMATILFWCVLNNFHPCMLVIKTTIGWCMCNNRKVLGKIRYEHLCYNVMIGLFSYFLG